MDGGGYSRPKISCVLTYRYMEFHYSIVSILRDTTTFLKFPK